MTLYSYCHLCHFVLWMLLDKTVICLSWTVMPNIASSLFFIIKLCPTMLIHMYLYPFIFHIGATASTQRDFFFFKKIELISLVTLSKDFCIRNKFTWISFHIKAWRSFNIGSRETLNGDTSSSSLAAKGFRSVRPNLQEKKSPTQVNRELYTVTLPLSMLCFQKHKGLFPLDECFLDAILTLLILVRHTYIWHTSTSWLYGQKLYYLYVHHLLLSPTLNLFPGVKHPAMKCPLT